jgi:hypothetical protein
MVAPSTVRPRDHAPRARSTADPVASPDPGRPAGPPEGVGEEDSRVAAGIVALLVVLVPLALVRILWAPPGGDLDWCRRIQVAPFDAVLVLVLGWMVVQRREVAALFSNRTVRGWSIALAVIGAVSFAAHPSPLGVVFALRLASGVGLIALIAVAWRSPVARRALLATIAIAGVAQAVLGMVQSLRGSTFGIAPLDFSWELMRFGSSAAAQGSLPHPYHLTGYLVVAQGAALLGLRQAAADRAPRWPWLVAVAVLACGTSITYSRAALLGQIAVVVAALVARADRRVLVAAAVAVVLGTALGAVGFGDGWVARSGRTVGAEGQSIDSHRTTRLKEAKGLIESSPVVGVGPGRYVDALADGKPGDYQPAHQVIAHMAAELGIPGGIVVVALLVVLGLRLLKGGSWTVMVGAPTFSLAMLGTIPYVPFTTLAMSGVWLGLVRASMAPVTASSEPPDRGAEAGGDELGDQLAGDRPAAVAL